MQNEPLLVDTQPNEKDNLVTKGNFSNDIGSTVPTLQFKNNSKGGIIKMPNSNENSIEDSGVKDILDSYHKKNKKPAVGNSINNNNL